MRDENTRRRSSRDMPTNFASSRFFTPYQMTAQMPLKTTSENRKRPRASELKRYCPAMRLPNPVNADTSE
jgi:hypothetical protein